ncbi:MAG: MinD/ParA family protein [Spirochaetaceae bacterium]|nr:MinD/ParA family protein [Spirochaetaceae bacterium]MBO4705323.1 MinD/ParA family protein [Spirochaetaceae bacterium]
MEDQASELRAMFGKSNYNNTSTSTMQPPHKTRVIAVTSGKGGVGKSNISVNLAIAFAQTGKKVVLIDGDLGMANVNVLLGITPKANLLDVLNKKKKMSDIILNTELGIQIIAGANGFSTIANLTDEQRDFFAEEFTTLSSFDVIIIDTGAGVSENVLRFIESADEAYVVTTPEPTAITDAYGLIKIIATEFSDSKIVMKLIVNKVHSADEGKRIAERIITIVAQFLNAPVEYLGFIYDDSVVTSSVLRQKPFMVSQPSSKAAMCIKHIVGRIDKTTVKPSGGFSAFLRKIIGKK